MYVIQKWCRANNLTLRKARCDGCEATLGLFNPNALVSITEKVGDLGADLIVDTKLGDLCYESVNLVKNLGEIKEARFDLFFVVNHFGKM